MSFLSPLAGLIALGGAVPLVAFLRSESARRRVTELLRIPEPSKPLRLGPPAAALTVAALLGLAATQPTFTRDAKRRVRTDAEAWFVLDTSRSMKASSSPSSPTRLDRAKSVAIRLRNELGNVPVGVASITDRVLPHLFPTGDEDTFAVTVREVMGVERPPPSNGFSTRITTLGSIGRIATDNFFSQNATKRLIVLFTDGETKSFADDTLGVIFRKPPIVHSLFVRVSRKGERVWNADLPDPYYRPDPSSRQNLRQLAATSGGTAVDAASFDRLVRVAKRDLGSGPSVVFDRQQRELSLAPWIACLAFLPLGFLLWRRNV